MKSHLMLAATALLAPVTADAQMRPAQRGEAMAYIAHAGAGDIYEVQSSQIAASRTRNPRVRAFARMLVMDHQRSTRMVAAAARAAGLRPRPAMLEPAQRRMLAELRAAPAGRFDQLYLSQQIPAHENALGLHRDYSRGGGVPGLRRVASGIVPVVEGHLAHARRLQR